MASFQLTTHEKIAKATEKCELKVQAVPFTRRNNVNAVWSIAFSPDRSRFAWSSGNRRVQILPWNALKNLPIADPANLIVPDNNNNDHQQEDHRAEDSDNDERMSCDGGSLDGEYSDGEAEWIQPKTIECGDIVLSLAFGSSLPHKKLRTSNVKYRMYDHSNTKLMLAIGLKSGKIKTYDIGKDATLHLMDHKDGIREMAFNPDGSLMLVSASADHTLKVWDMKDDGNMVKTLREHQKPVISCSFSPNGKVMASVGSNKMAILWDMTSSITLIHRLIGHHHDIVGCHFSTDGALLATASWDARVCVWDPYTGEVLQQLHHVFPPLPTVFAGGANNNFVRGVAFSPDGSHIATVCDDKYVRFWSLWETSDPEVVYPLENALACTYSPDGAVLAAGTRCGQVKFLEAPMKVNKLQHMCRLSIRRMVQDTRELPGLRGYLPGEMLRYLAYKDIYTEYEEEV
ncbi:WD repeat and SOCS box-containing protein 1-like [Amphiura filiformis]|uniref:WD repeat and SOCS box-containing protein 1-like n=1 Tax=Amphiura filiformis TaxID=82378 RepID=UPI003B228B66